MGHPQDCLQSVPTGPFLHSSSAGCVPDLPAPRGSTVLPQQAIQQTQKSALRRKCAVCKIVVHTACIEQLEKNFVRHHWVHRRRQDGKCKQCGKGFQQKFSFHSKEIVAISCSWCKQAFHNKVTCFMLHHIEEPCSLGAHAAVIVPPTWIIKVKKPQNSLKASSRKKKRTSFKRKASKRGTEENKGRPFVIKPISSPLMKPLLVFVNPKSGGNQGTKVLQMFMWYLNPRQVFDLSQEGPKDALELYRKVPNLRILACGGDGTEWGMTPSARGSSALLSDEADQNFYGRLLGRKVGED
ncbi:hypothetical protein U0070_014665 [Myodes glareolus]|uniref:DAGKc domain-containing protein n=1 Tax=Myodes glareolus TaxID=447135 RepID=A0AAW0IUR6_MYOGA